MSCGANDFHNARRFNYQANDIALKSNHDDRTKGTTSITKEKVMKPLDVTAAVYGLVGLAALYQALFWKRVQGRWLEPAAGQTR